MAMFSGVESVHARLSFRDRIRSSEPRNTLVSGIGIDRLDRGHRLRPRHDAVYLLLAGGWGYWSNVTSNVCWGEGIIVWEE